MIIGRAKMTSRLWVLLVALTSVRAVIRPSAITLTNNGYSGILVAIDPAVSEDLALIDDIKSMFTDGSASLYEATEKRAYFHDVTILVPNSWALNPAWKPAASQLYSNADVIIQNPPSSTRQASPAGNKTRTVHLPKESQRAYTRTYGGCGQQGVRINIFTDVFSIRKPYGPAGKVLVHEWAQFRWGVFNEYAHQGESQFYFSPTTGKLEAIRCNIQMKGRIYRVDPGTGKASLCSQIDPSTGSYQDGCVFNPYTRGSFNLNVTASIMDRTQVPSIVHFCTDDKSQPNRVHNYEAPSQHNRICGSRSTWSVIAQSPDFHGNANPSRSIPDITPSFQVVRQANRRRMVMALDTSHSMQLDAKLTRVRQAAASLINDALDDEAQVGVVTFSGQARVASPVQQLTGNDVRKKISQELPNKATGITSIGAALLKSIETAQDHDPDANDTFIVMLTDGKDTAKPTVTDVKDRVRASGAVVNVVALSGQADPSLYDLAYATGGRYYYDNNNAASTSTLDAMMDILSVFDAGKWKQPVQVMSRSEALYSRPDHVMKGYFYVDKSLGRDTKMVVTYTDQVPAVTFNSPGGRPYDSIYPEYSIDTDLKRIRIFVPGLSETGHWTYRITNTAAAQQTVTVMVLSHGKDSHVEPLRLSGALLFSSDQRHHSRIVAEVRRGGAPVLNLKVKAVVSRPVGSPIKVELFDGGSGADIIKDDGLYSRYFLDFNAEGHYSVQIEVMDVHQGQRFGRDSEQGTMACVNAGSTFYATKPTKRNVAQLPKGRLTSLPGDHHPPMRISDLRVLHTSNNDSTVILAWTSPGDDLDKDKASFYTLLLAYKAEDIFTDANRVELTQDAILDGDLGNPKPFGNKEQMTVKISLAQRTANMSLVFAVFAIDDAGNKGEMSNLATVGLGFVPDFSNAEYLNQVRPELDKKAVPKGQKVVITAVVGAFSGLLALVVVGSIVTYAISSWRKGRSKMSSDESNERKRNKIV